MSYTVLKPINLGGKRRFIGEVIETEVVVKERANTLVKNGYLAEIQTLPELVADTKQTNKVIKIPIIQDEESMDVNLYDSDIIQIFMIMQMPVEEAINKIPLIEDENLLILLHATDSRKRIKTAAVEQAKKLKEASEQAKEGE